MSELIVPINLTQADTNGLFRAVVISQLFKCIQKNGFFSNRKLCFHNEF